MMLFADRFLVEEVPRPRPSGGGGDTMGAIDVASAGKTRIYIAPAGDRGEQEAWSQACAGKYAAGTLIDFGFIGSDCRFEAASARGSASIPFAPTPAHIIDWLESSPASSSRVRSVSCMPDPRDLRLRGFVPLSLACLHALAELDVRLLGQRSVVLLVDAALPTVWPLALLALRHAGPRDVHVLWRRSAGNQHRALAAAESRPTYGPSPLAGDPRARNLAAEGERLLALGRHAAADRALRAAIGGLARRGDLFRAANAEMALAQLLLTRGRAADAASIFESAVARFQHVRAATCAVDAALHKGLAETDLERFEDAEQTCRVAQAAAAGLGDPDLSLRCSVALSRVLWWQRRHREALDLLEATRPCGGPHAMARYWCLVARLHLHAGHLPNARRAIDQLRRDADSTVPAIEALLRRCEAAIQAAVGDHEALAHHVRTGLRAARSAHLPLESLRLRLVMIDGLIAAGRHAAARQVAARLRNAGRSQVPPLLKASVERTLARIEQGEESTASRPDRARESASVFESRSYDPSDELRGLGQLLDSSHEYEDEAEALTRAAASIRHHTGALGVGIFGCAGAVTHLFASSGPHDRTIARRAFDAGLAIGPESTGGWVSAAVPMRYLGRFIGALSLRWTSEGPANVDRTRAFGGAATAACAPLVYVLQERQGVVCPETPVPDLIGVSSAIGDVMRAVGRAASAPFTVLIEGESGAGKELVARAIHRSGCRRDRAFCALNCAAMPEDLIDAELFGHARGAFTGAANERLGLFESADGGSLFLDEVGELSPRAQAKVLRALQEGEIRRIGETVTRSFDARLIAATNRSLRAEVEAGRFRQDLLYRLDVIRIHVPPLRQRLEDIPLLAARFWGEAAARIDSRAVLGKSAVSALTRYDWPGNVRELQNVLTALVVAAPRRGVVGDSALPSAIARATPPETSESLESARQKFEQRFVRAALARAAGHRGRTAAALGVSRQGLAKLMERLQLDA